MSRQWRSSSADSDRTHSLPAKTTPANQPIEKRPAGRLRFWPFAKTHATVASRRGALDERLRLANLAPLQSGESQDIVLAVASCRNARGGPVLFRARLGLRTLRHHKRMILPIGLQASGSDGRRTQYAGSGNGSIMHRVKDSDSLLPCVFTVSEEQIGLRIGVA